MDGRAAREPRRKLALEARNDVEPHLDPCVIGAGDLVSELDEGAKVASLRGEEDRKSVV